MSGRTASTRQQQPRDQRGDEQRLRGARDQLRDVGLDVSDYRHDEYEIEPLESRRPPAPDGRDYRAEERAPERKTDDRALWSEIAQQVAGLRQGRRRLGVDGDLPVGVENSSPSFRIGLSGQTGRGIATSAGSSRYLLPLPRA